MREKQVARHASRVTCTPRDKDWPLVHCRTLLGVSNEGVSIGAYVGRVDRGGGGLPARVRPIEPPALTDEITIVPLNHVRQNGASFRRNAAATSPHKLKRFLLRPLRPHIIRAFKTSDHAIISHKRPQRGRDAAVTGKHVNLPAVAHATVADGGAEGAAEVFVACGGGGRSRLYVAR